MIVEIHHDARAEFDDAVDWYQIQSQQAADRFATEVEAAIESIAADPDRFERVDPECQRFGLRVFPYSIYFGQFPNKLVIYAVAHAKRRHRYWRNRIED